MAAIDEQMGGDHYRKMAIQPIQFITANNLGFCEGNIIKYVCRWPQKGGVEDLKKARHYIDLLIESQSVRGPRPGTVVLTDKNMVPLDMRCM